MPGSQVDLRLSEEALDDLEAIITWYESQAALQAAESVLTTILAAIESLIAHPEAGAIAASGFRERVISTLPYRVVYQFDPLHNKVIVYAVVHTRRQVPVGSRVSTVRASC